MLSLSLSAFAETNTVVPLWTNSVPGSLGDRPADNPTLTLYLADPDNATGAAIIVCPGGGYVKLSDHEKIDYAIWLNQLGISAFVLKYRLGSAGYRHPAMFQDAARAVRTVRAHAKEWGVDPQRIGIMGSSAGGHLAATLLTQFDAGREDDEDPIERQSSRPDLGILCYPVITMGEFTHQGSKKNLLGENPPADLVNQLSAERHVRTNTPPCFIWHTWEDRGVPAENAMMFADELRRAGVKFELHIYEKGRHGLGLGAPVSKPELWHPWTRDCAHWLRERGFAN